MNTTSLELSKQLKEAGFPQESYFLWNSRRQNGTESIQMLRREQVGVLDFETQSIVDLYFAAPTAEEILEQLPNYVYIVSAGGGRHGARVDYVVGENWHTRELWSIAMAKGFERDTVPFEVRDKVVANALAKMWLYLKENHLLTKDSKEAQTKIGATSEAVPTSTGGTE